MKSLFKKALLCVAAMTILSMVACQKAEEKEQTASFYLTYTITTDGGQVMPGTKATSAEVFDEFYQKIKSGNLVAPNYDLVFTEKTTGAVYTVNGTWAGKDMITLRTGNYKVVGTSTAAGENIQDKCSLIFEDDIVVDVSSKTITLNAAYDCSLIIFSDASIAKLSNFNGVSSTDLFTFSNYIYAFINTQLWAEGKQADAYLAGTHTNGTQFKIYTGNLNYETGKFYVYNDISTAFSLEKMEEGGDVPAGAVDLGLSVLWATCNIGATSPEEYGTYFAWGDVTGQTWDGSEWSGGGFSSSPSYELDENNNLKPEYDAAHVNLGGNWRMPTNAEYQELIDNCTSTLTINYKSTGVAGIIFTSNKEGYTDKSIFLPVAGYGDGSYLFTAGSGGDYWSGTFRSGSNAWDLRFDSNNVFTSNDDRGYGFSVRPVYD